MPQLKRECLCWRTLVQPAGVITRSQIHSSYFARARISEFESSHPSHAVGLYGRCLPASTGQGVFLCLLLSCPAPRRAFRAPPGSPGLVEEAVLAVDQQADDLALGD